MKLTIFNELDFLPALRALFEDLQVPINAVTDQPIAASELLTSTHESLNSIADVYFLGMVDDAAFKGKGGIGLAAVKQIEQDYEGIVIFGVTLNRREGGLLPTRSHLAEISRAFNQEFRHTPVVVVFRYGGEDGEYLAFANTERLKYQNNREGEKAGKVTLLRDIDIRQPHSGHERILADLKIPTVGKDRVDSFAKLYAYWQKVLDVSLLSKKFYRDLSNWYLWAVKQVTFPSEPTLEDAYTQKVDFENLRQEHKAKNVIRLLTRLLFVWFIKEKGLIPKELFELDTLQSNILKNISPYYDLGLFKQVSKESVYYKAILQNLFFATLNCPIKPMESGDNRVRGFRKMDNYGQHRDANFLMRYEKHFQHPDRFVEMVNGVVPFLNGGLFECLDDKLNKVYIDGFSDNLARGEQLIVPDYLFFGTEEKVDLSVEYGVNNKGTKEAAVKGLINILKAYKFTITENTPIEEDVALDPELLGKVFENLLASYNPETKTTARKQTGSFYTPREIVNYMVDESLIAYLKNELQAGESGYQVEDLDRRLHQLVSFDAINPFDEDAEVQQSIIKALDKCTILDPACGSGAFPMGILQKMVHILFKVDPNNTGWKQRQITRVELAIAQLEELEDAQYRDSSIQDLEAQKKDIEEAFRNNELDYGRKLYLIENCIYGVDIQPIAIQISKLRFFISLVVDQRVVPNKEINFGIRPLPNLETKFVAANTLIGIEKPQGQLSLFDTSEEIKKLEVNLKKVRHRLFSSKSPSHKRKLRDEDKALREQIAVVLQKHGWKADTANQLANWNPYNLNDSAGFFDPEWMFDISDGFNVVIGNPPYGINFNKQDEKKLISLFLPAKKVPDSYCFFMLQGLNFVKENGCLTYIVPNTFCDLEKGDEFRDFLLNNYRLTHIFQSGWAFESAIVDTLILFLDKSNVKNNKVKIKIDSQEYERQISDFLDDPLVKIDYRNPPSVNNLRKKIFAGSIPLREIADIKAGVKMYEKGKGSPPQNDEIIKQQPYSRHELCPEGWRTLYRGKDINRYHLSSPSEFVDYGIRLAAPRNPDLFQSPKILMRRTDDHLMSALEYDSAICVNSCHVIKLKDEFVSNYSYEFILGLLNSKLMQYIFDVENPQMVGKVFAEIKVVYVERLPIKTISPDSQKFISIIVDYITYLHQSLKDIPSHGEKLMVAADDKLMLSYFEQIVDAVVMELYLPEELHAGEKYFMRHLLQENLPSLDQLKGDKIAALRGIFRRLFDREHPIRVNIYFLDSLEVVRIVGGKA
jgi:adenine-specific DNA-methyltransferase